ncbi:hypothetical protein F4780DRAFT_784178 [Xylariomycetidae sp. FL0641]|nr:hypothetical protein F4780DRAFT_784178 [Xylariomycetidae sp. FL0641]
MSNCATAPLDRTPTFFLPHPQTTPSRMCMYVELIPLCGHAPLLLAGPSCPDVRAQLARIAGPAAWTPAGRAALPFAWADACLPRRGGNVRRVRTGRWCGWECRNSHALGWESLRGEDGAGVPEDEQQQQQEEEMEEMARRLMCRMGMLGARYAVPRPGIGWREE